MLLSRGSSRIYLFSEHFSADETFCHLHENWDLNMLSVITYFIQFCDYKFGVGRNDGLLSPPAQPRVILVLNFSLPIGA